MVHVNTKDFPEEVQQLWWCCYGQWVRIDSNLGPWWRLEGPGNITFDLGQCISQFFLGLLLHVEGDIQASTWLGNGSDWCGGRCKKLIKDWEPWWLGRNVLGGKDGGCCSNCLFVEMQPSIVLSVFKGEKSEAWICPSLKRCIFIIKIIIITFRETDIPSTGLLPKRLHWPGQTQEYTISFKSPWHISRQLDGKQDQQLSS